LFRRLELLFVLALTTCCPKHDPSTANLRVAWDDLLGQVQRVEIAPLAPNPGTYLSLPASDPLAKKVLSFLRHAPVVALYIHGKPSTCCTPSFTVRLCTLKKTYRFELFWLRRAAICENLPLIVEGFSKETWEGLLLESYERIFSEKEYLLKLALNSPDTLGMVATGVALDPAWREIFIKREAFRRNLLLCMACVFGRIISQKETSFKYCSAVAGIVRLFLSLGERSIVDAVLSLNSNERTASAILLVLLLCCLNCPEVSRGIGSVSSQALVDIFSRWWKKHRWQMVVSPDASYKYRLVESDIPLDPLSGQPMTVSEVGKEKERINELTRFFRAVLTSRCSGR